jgi:flavin-dependent dehydrogenase
MTRLNCDVLIVGGGPSGSSLAWGLRHSGLKLIIVDKKSFPRDKTCAGWITPAVVDTLQIDLDDYGRNNTLQAINGFRVGTIHGRAVNIDYGKTPVSYGIRRYELDHYLLQRSGAELKLGFNVRDIKREADSWTINDQISTRLLVGAGGNFCPVARLMGAKPGKSEIAVRAQEIEFKMNSSQASECPVDPAVPELYFCDDLKGYGWVFRKKDYLNIGLGREDDSGLPAHVRDFCEYLQNQNRIPAGLPDHFNGHAYLLYNHANRRLFDDKLLLLGDSAGLAYTQSGEGIRPAVESGLIAANLIINAQGDYSKKQLRQYQDNITRRFGKRITGDVSSQHEGNNILPGFLKKRLAHQLLGMKWFIRKYVISEWFLHQSQGYLNLP